MVVKVGNWAVNISRMPIQMYLYLYLYLYFIHISTYLWWSRWAIERWILAGCQSKVRSILRGVEWCRMQLAMQLGPKFFTQTFPLAYLSYLLPPPIQGKVIWGSGRFKELHFKCESFGRWWNTEIQIWTDVEIQLLWKWFACFWQEDKSRYWPWAEVEKFSNLLLSLSVTCTHIVTQIQHFDEQSQ